MDFIELLSSAVICLIVAMLFMSVMFLIGRRIGRYDIVDVAWGLTFVIVVLVSFMIAPSDHAASLVLLGLVAIWGARLSSHIYRRLRASSHEDRRYVELRQKWHAANEDLAMYLRVYLVQALLATIVCLPVLVVNAAQTDVSSMFLWVGLALWVGGFICEAAADRQLRAFIRDPQNKGRLMMSGLWRYSRHPNYFGELVQWWAIGVIALGVPYGWIGFVGPLTITYLIVFVSGIPLIEKVFEGRAGWSEYKSRTSVLIPWFVRRDP